MIALRVPEHRSASSRSRERGCASHGSAAALGILSISALVALGGCMLVLDTDRFREPAGAADAGNGAIDDGSGMGIPVAYVEPPRVLEGALAPVIVGGQGFREDLVVRATLDPAGRDQPVDVVAWLVSPDGTELGVLLDVPVVRDHASGDPPLRVRITVIQTPDERHAEVTLDGLPELDVGAGELSTGELDDLYSEITVSTAARLVGTAPARLAATRAISVYAAMRADGEHGEDTAGGSGGAGGCAGGASAEPGGCEPGGGTAGSSSLESSTPGGDGGGGRCRDGVCTAALVPLGEPSNRGHGGGGGGNYELAVGQGEGGGGGGGGGVIELSAPLVVLNADVSVNGGNGAPGRSNECSQGRHGGGGGGGSGGVVVVRADRLVVDRPERLFARGGAGGETCGVKAGRGDEGRARIDVATIESTGGISDPAEVVDFFSGTPWRGPRLSPSVPRLALAGALDIQVTGDPELTYGLRVGQGDTIQVAGNQTVTVPLERGRHEVCAQVLGVDPNRREARHCLSVAVLRR